MVSAARIRGIDRSTYHDLQQAFVDENGWAHQEPYLHGRTDLMSDSFFSYILERTWNLRFQCPDMVVAWKCPSLISGWRTDGNVGDCQCFDLRAPKCVTKPSEHFLMLILNVISGGSL